MGIAEKLALAFLGAVVLLGVIRLFAAPLKLALKVLLNTLLGFGALFLFGMELGGSLLITSLLGFFFLVVVLCIYSDTTRNRFSVVSGREVFTSGKATFRRDRGKLVLREKLLPGGASCAPGP